MDIPLWLIEGLVAVNLLILAILYVYLRLFPRTSHHNVLLGSCLAMLPFIIHAFLFFEGVFFIVQMTMIAGVLSVVFATSQR